MITYLYLRAAGLHFRLSAFFDSPDSPEYHSHLYSLWYATTAFLECVFHLYKIDGGLVPHASNYILQMIVAAGFTLLKLLNSFFADNINNARGRELFMKTIRAIRTISVATNDLPSRLAEVLAQLWKSGGSGARNGHTANTSIDSSLQLKVRCRMSMSLVHDSVWRWREAFQTKGPDKLEGKPTLTVSFMRDTCSPATCELDGENKTDMAQPLSKTQQILTRRSNPRPAPRSTIAVLPRPRIPLP